MTASTPLIVTFLLYLLAMVGIGFVAWRSTKNFDDYILGGRSLGPGVTALSAGASDMSGWLLMGLPGAMYLGGVSEAWIAIGLVAGAWANWKFVAGPLRVYTERTDNALTLPDFFTSRFHDTGRALRVLSAVVILVFFAVYCASGIVAGGRLFESVFGLPYAQAIWWGAAVTILYTLVGGFLAVSWTDTAQGVLMLFALLLTPILLIVATGGFDSTLAAIRAEAPARLDWFRGGELGLVGIVSLIAWGLGYFGQPHILARFMAAGGVHTIPVARRIGMTWMILCLAGSLTVGFLGIGYFAEHPESAGPVIANPERVFIAVVELLFNPWVAGVILSAILAAVMSTLSSQLLVCSSVLSEDFYRGFLRKQASQTELVWVGRGSVLLVALVAMWLARDPDSRVLGLVSYAWAGFGAAFGPVVLLALFWQRMTRNGALTGMVAGAATVILWKQVAVGMYGSGLYEIVPGFIAATVAIILVSRLDREPPQEIQAVHMQVRASLRETGY
ncbi:sodium/proline symporter PutP [Novilysobacter selenitireducens]|uniref:Sodium/proline symporter n=1 Tax=Novilysobacter selenitireducens TaxID=2872639 RepID=A0ABS7T940_9GAMM|nr:sodium/proline symporter PutP [Lysobacter selenitireducens]MBZ4040392.1 sodium/proline symporter PutP [Lysobacter selenitireducens]